MRIAVFTVATALALTAGCAAQNDAAQPEATGSAEPTGNATTTGNTTTTDAGSDKFPVTVDTPLGEVTIEERPQRIVSLSPSATEVLFAIGAGDQVVAADEYSTYPEEAPDTDLSGFEPNVEAIAGYQPDLVVIANDTGNLADSLTNLGIPVLLSEAPPTIEEGYDELAALGQATGNVDQTAQVISTMREDIATAMAKTPNAPIRIYHELDDQYHAASSYSFIGSIYKEMGATNIADPADTAQTGYPQLTEEAIITADPQLIVITDQVAYTAEDVAQRPGWSEISAVQEGNIATVDADIASRWGPRLPQLVDTIAEAMNKAVGDTGGQTAAPTQSATTPASAPATVG